MGTTGQSITLANSIIGVGILAMPFCFQQCGILLATLILLSMGLVSRLCCHFLLKSALFARRRNFEFLALQVFGPAGKMAVELGIIGFLMGTCIAYFVVVGDLGPQIIAKMFNINQSDILRTSIMVLVSLICVLPLGLLRNVDSLSNVSAATIGFYFCLVIKVITEAASRLFTIDWDTRLEMWKPQGVLQCVPIFSMALFCQTQLFEIFESLPTLSLEKMNAVTKNAINICTAVYFTLGLFGYIAFSKHEISGNILMSLSPTMTSDVIKLGFVMSLAFSFPLIIFPCRASLYSFLYRKAQPSQHDHIINHSIPEGTFRCMTVGIVGSALVVSLLVPTIELVLGLAGSTIGVLVCVIFPTACFVRLTSKNTNERVLAKVILVLGIVIMVLGTYANLQAAENTHEKYDDKHITQERIDKMVEDFFQSKKLENEGVVIKPPEKIEPILKEIVNKKEAAIDSEVQPPNPVPPESQPVDKNDSPPNLDKPQIADQNTLEKLDQLEIKDEVDKVSKTHPKNLKKIIDAKFTKGVIKKEEKIEIPKKDIKEFNNQQRIDLIKQVKLMETIKEHKEEQKALIKEQNEILENIMKTKQELQQNNNEAKKIAVESIQKIANVAIQSLSVVSDKPADNFVKKVESGDTANDAVKKIADVAVEAIKELKNQPLHAVPIPNKQNVPNEVNAVPAKDIQKEIKQSESIVQNYNPPLKNNILAPAQIENMPVEKIDIKASETIPEPVNRIKGKVNNTPVVITPVVNADPVVNNPPVSNNSPVVNKSPVVNSAPVVNNAARVNNVLEVNNAPVVNELIANLASNKIESVEEKLVQSNLVQEKQQIIVQNKEHSHTPDEPLSYKEGEEAQKKSQINSNMLNNVPLPLAMNGNNIKLAETKHNILKNPNIYDTGAKEPINEANDNTLLRQKREVVDCTNKETLRVEDRVICKSLVNPDAEGQEILPKVDLNDALPKNLPLVDMNMVHHMRSLKSYNEEEGRYNEKYTV